MALKTRAYWLIALLVAGNIIAWLITWSASHTYALLLSTGVLAYGFGLRHAVDADHISAIDNTTRKLMQQGKKPLGVGFFFSLGHSTIVILLCAALALSTSYVEKHLPQWRSIGGIAGTLVSTFFLYLIGFINLVVLIDLIKAFRRVAAGESYDALGWRVDEAIDKLVAKYPGKRIVVVTHNGVAKQAVRLATGGSPDSIFHIDVSPCSISTISIWPSDGLRALRSANEQGHLR